MAQSLEADEGIEPQAFILCISTGSCKLCKREAAYVSYLGNFHGAPLDHGITQVCWDFGGWGASYPSSKLHLTKISEQRFTRLIIAQKGVGRGCHH